MERERGRKVWRDDSVLFEGEKKKDDVVGIYPKESAKDQSGSRWQKTKEGTG